MIQSHKLPAFWFIWIFFILMGSVFTFVGLDFVKIQCANKTCSLERQAFGFISLTPKHIKEITSVELEERRSRNKSTFTIISNVVLKSDSANIDVFMSYSNTNTSEKNTVLYDLKKVVYGENINKTYGKISVFFYIGFILLCIPLGMLVYSLTKK